MTKDESLKMIVDLLQPIAALAEGPMEHSETIQRCVDAVEIALDALNKPTVKQNYRGARLVLTEDSVIQDGWVGDK